MARLPLVREHTCSSYHEETRRRLFRTKVKLSVCPQIPPDVTFTPELHLGVSMRSFRAEHVSLLVKQLLDLDTGGARETLSLVSDKYPIVITRDLDAGKAWVKSHARGSERYGVVVSSQAGRKRPTNPMWRERSYA